MRRNKPLNFCLSNDWKKKTRTFQASTLHSWAHQCFYRQRMLAGIITVLFFWCILHCSSHIVPYLLVALFNWIFLKDGYPYLKKNLVLFKNITYQETNKELTICEGQVISVLKSEYRNLPPLMNYLNRWIGPGESQAVLCKHGIGHNQNRA